MDVPGATQITGTTRQDTSHRAGLLLEKDCAVQGPCGAPAGSTPVAGNPRTLWHRNRRVKNEHEAS
jgi:hypothetical protein